jgi:exopolyphosphatase/guanosine-5'-triphosphate,3'-diphosphate pyrophosphatase
VARLALQLYDGLAGNGVPAEPAVADLRGILQVAALLHDVGRSKHEKGHHKASYRLIRRMASPLGWSRESLRIAGIVARYHRGSLPRPGQKALRGLSPGQRQSVLQLAGMLRLADAFDIPRDGRIQRLDVRHEDGFFVIGARGYSARDRRAEAIAGARHLLEIVYRRPVIVQPLRPSRKPTTSN